MNLEQPLWESRFEAFLARDGAFGDAAHDLGHIRRVVATALVLAQQEAAEVEVVFAAAWLHDCVAVAKDSPDRPRASQLAAVAASEFLSQSGWPQGQIPRVAHAIEAHSFSAQIAPRSVEARVVQDADRLDALGAHGLARCLMLAGSFGSGLAHPTDPWGVSRPRDDTRWAVDHFFLKLLGLPQTMQTTSGRREALIRSEVLTSFLRSLARERGIEDPPDLG